MFSTSRRRILDGLNRRYIYGRLVCELLVSIPSYLTQGGSTFFLKRATFIK